MGDEALVGQQMLDALQKILVKLGAAQLPRPTWGPALHRWGAAFPKPDVEALGAQHIWVLPDERLIFAGDFLAPPNACIAAALRSGISAGDALVQIADGMPP